MGCTGPSCACFIAKDSKSAAKHQQVKPGRSSIQPYLRQRSAPQVGRRCLTYTLVEMRSLYSDCLCDNLWGSCFSAFGRLVLTHECFCDIISNQLSS
jgi:hypothetical protein